MDVIEWQTTAGYIPPSGTDSDGDGLDDAFDDDVNNFGDAGNNDTPTNTDGTDNPDYLDLNSDNTEQNDAVEAWDTNNDGTAETLPSGSDADGDGLDDAYDTNDAAVNPTNGNTPSSFPNLDGGTPERDWRESIDTDGDGIADDTDLDDDNDGIPDVVEGPGDTDGDGIPDRIDLDSDNDGITDVIEGGGSDPDNNGIIGIGQVPPDADMDGLADVVDPDNGGTPLVIKDTDGDGQPDAQDLDSDNDGITDVVENGLPDPDNDGIIGSSIPVDTDGDGIADVVDQQAGFGDTGNTNFEADFDGDGVPNANDIDSDGDGLTDVVESGGTDANNDGIADGGDSDGDGIPDSADQQSGFGDAGNTDVPTDTDGTGGPNYLDIDSDDDGIVDVIEWQTTTGYVPPSGVDSDGDGLDNTYDDNVNNFGDAGNNDTPTNTDGTDKPDYLDMDSDNDGVSDWVEGWDSNNDNVADVTPSGMDNDGDGLDDAFDNNDNAVNPTNSQTPMDFPNMDGGTIQRDWREANVPDLSIAITINPNQVQGDGVNQKVRIVIEEVLGNPTNGTDIFVSIPVSAKYTLLPYNSGLTQINGLPVVNSSWSFVGTSGGFHYWKYEPPGGVIAAFDATAFGFEMTWNSASQDGTLNLVATIFTGSGGDTNVLNNRDGEVINFNK